MSKHIPGSGLWLSETERRIAALERQVNTLIKRVTELENGMEEL